MGSNRAPRYVGNNMSCSRLAQKLWSVGYDVVAAAKMSSSHGDLTSTPGQQFPMASAANAADIRSEPTQQLPAAVATKTSKISGASEQAEIDSPVVFQFLIGLEALVIIFIKNYTGVLQLMSASRPMICYKTSMIYWRLFGIGKNPRKASGRRPVAKQTKNTSGGRKKSMTQTDNSFSIRL